MCQRTYCPDCDEELIHRDHRHFYESASALGQIIHRMKRTFTYGDMDGVTYKRSLRLLRFLEHKQPDQSAKYAQNEVHDLLDEIIAHYVDCVTARFRLHPYSGMYVMRGPIEAATTGRRAAQLAGPQELINNRLGCRSIADEMALFEWLDGQ
jgi:hypothetical protein